jgi:hypothetical protein
MTISGDNSSLDYGDDIIAIERSGPRQSVVGMAGQCTLSAWREADGTLRKFDCRIRGMTPQIITIEAPVTGSVGQWVVASFPQLGGFEGPIFQVVKRAFIMRIVATNDDRARIAATVAWAQIGKPDARRFPRSKPSNPNATLSISSGQRLPCQIIDYSIAGVAVSTEAAPSVGTVVKIGKLLGSVVRRFAGGFAISFVALQRGEQIESLISDASDVHEQ